MFLLCFCRVKWSGDFATQAVAVGELLTANVVIQNDSNARLLNLHVATSRPDVVVFADSNVKPVEYEKGNPSVVVYNTGDAG